MPPLPATALSDARIAASSGIFLASYLVFALGKFLGLKIDRAGAAIISAVGMGAFRIVAPQQALSFIDYGTIVLLFSMMLIVGNLHLVGFFECSDNHGQRGEHHCGRKCEAGCGNRFLGLLSCGLTHHRCDSRRGMDVAGWMQ